MKSIIISEIFNRGQKQRIKSSDEYQSALHKAVEIENILKNRLSKENYDLVLLLEDAGCDLEKESLECYYKEGFKLGLLLGLECRE